MRMVVTLPLPAALFANWNCKFPAFAPFATKPRTRKTLVSPSSWLMFTVVPLAVTAAKLFLLLLVVVLGATLCLILSGFRAHCLVKTSRMRSVPRDN